MREIGQQKDGRWTVTLQGLQRVDQALKRVPWGVLLCEPVAPV